MINCYEREECNNSTSSFDADLELEKATEFRRINIDEKLNDSNSSETLKSLTELLTSLSTISELINSQSESIEGSNLYNDSDNSDEIENAVVETDTPADIQSTNNSTSLIDTHSIKRSESINKLIMKIERKISFLPALSTADEEMIANLNHLKSDLNRFDNLESLLIAINDFIDSGNDIDDEIFFLFLNVYSLPRPEKYYIMFRHNIFNHDSYLGGGKGKMIQAFLTYFNK